MRLLLALSVILLASSCASPPPERPNIVVILADDMGFSDIGSYGGEIPTPNLDRLADSGLRFTQFYNTARCSPSRASLLTGLHPHQSGMGSLMLSPSGTRHERPEPGHRGYLSLETPTIAEILHEAGYHTYMTGKWHLGFHDPVVWPRQRGFDRFYGPLAGAGNYFRPSGVRGMLLDNERLPEPDSAYYATDAFTDYAIRFIEEQEDDAPFFLYVAHMAPHWPLHAPEEDVRKFVGHYREGWDVLRQQRHQRQLEMGLLDSTWTLSTRDEDVRAWDALSEEEKSDLDYRMAVYAAQIHRMDWNVGRLIDFLESRDQLDNTLILFLSDNGACSEPWRDTGGRPLEDVNNPEKSGMISYGQGWANASNTPFRGFKSLTYEGGIATPLIAHWPARLSYASGSFLRTPAYLPDLAPTFLEMAGVPVPDSVRFEGHSLLPMLESGDEEAVHEWMFWEHERSRAVRNGNWKLVWDRNHEQWELFDLSADRTELSDLAASHPDRVEDMARRWQEWAERVQVFPMP